VNPILIREGGRVIMEKPEKDLFSPLCVPDFYASWRTSLKQMLLTSLAMNEQMAKEALTWCEKTMTLTIDMPWAPACKTFVTSARKFVEDTSGRLQRMWHLEHARDGPDSVPKL